MAGVTLEALAARVAELERRVAVGSPLLPTGPAYNVRPGTGDWAAAAAAALALSRSTYDWDAICELNDADVAALKRDEERR